MNLKLVKGSQSWRDVLFFTCTCYKSSVCRSAKETWLIPIRSILQQWEEIIIRASVTVLRLHLKRRVLILTVFYHWVSSPKYVMMVHLNVNKEVKVRLNREYSNVLWEINLTVILVTRKRNAVFLKNNKRQQVQREKQRSKNSALWPPTPGMGVKVEVKSSVLTQKLLSERQDVNHQRAQPVMPTHHTNLQIKISWSMVCPWPKAGVKSKNTSSTQSPESAAKKSNLKSLNRADSVLQ